MLAFDLITATALRCLGLRVRRRVRRDQKATATRSSTDQLHRSRCQPHTHRQFSGFWRSFRISTARPSFDSKLPICNQISEFRLAC